jgi:hypothetical protein
VWGSFHPFFKKFTSGEGLEKSKQGGFLVTKNAKQGVKTGLQKYLSALLYSRFFLASPLPSDEAQG